MIYAYIVCTYFVEVLMQVVFDSNAPKKPTNLSINSDLLNQAKNLHINVSAVLESALAENLNSPTLWMSSRICCPILRPEWLFPLSPQRIPNTRR
ncbi:MAG: type II toxin-antitoxin system CcdA family antitoxin [Rectinemataceae bacterium]